MPSSRKAIFEKAKVRAGKLEAKGKAVDFDELLRMEPDGGTTNVRNTSSAHWKPWLGVASRCVVPLTSFSEFDHGAKQDVWLALSHDRPGLLRRYLDAAVDRRAQDQERRRDHRPVRVPHHRAEP